MSTVNNDHVTISKCDPKYTCGKVGKIWGNTALSSPYRQDKRCIRDVIWKASNVFWWCHLQDVTLDIHSSCGVLGKNVTCVEKYYCDSKRTLWQKNVIVIWFDKCDLKVTLCKWYRDVIKGVILSMKLWPCRCDVSSKIVNRKMTFNTTKITNKQW